VKRGWLSITPRHLPSLALMLEDIACDVASFAQHVGVSVPTVRRWIAAGVAPRSAMLAVFFETQWGRSFVACETENRARLVASQLSCERSQVRELRATVDRLVTVGAFGSANAPTMIGSAMHFDAPVLEADIFRSEIPPKVGTGATAPSGQRLPLPNAPGGLPDPRQRSSRGHGRNGAPVVESVALKARG
jgi:hypothetical protein